MMLKILALVIRVGSVELRNCISPIADAHNFKDAFEKCQAALPNKDDDELAQEMNKLKVESTQDSTRAQQEGDDKKEEQKLQENKTKTESITDPQTSSKDSAATTEDTKPAETK